MNGYLFRLVRDISSTNVPLFIEIWIVMIRLNARNKASHQISATQGIDMSNHDDVFARIQSLLEDENDWVSAMSTVVCELHNSFEHFHWTGFYRTVEPNVLKVGPYQGGHGCLVIPFDKGICGAAARTGKTQDVPDVHARTEHIACSSTTLSEVVVPIKSSNGQVVAVLDLDSDLPAAFSTQDISFTEHLCQYLGAKFFE